MKVEVRGKRARAFGITGFIAFAAVYVMYSFYTIRSIVSLTAWEPFSLAKPEYISLFIELIFFLGMIYLAVDGSVKYFKDHPSGTFPHGIRLVMTFAFYSFVYPIYNKFLIPSQWGGFEFIDLVTTTTGIALIVSLAFAIASFFLVNKPKHIRHIVFGGVFAPMVLLDILDVIWNVPLYGKFWYDTNYYLIFGPTVRILAYGFLIASYLVEKKKQEKDGSSYIAYCGLNCKECDAYKATINNDDKLREAVAEEWSKLNNTVITKEMINCEGCKRDGKKTPYCESLCEVKKCASKKGIELCKDCQNYENCKKRGAIQKTS